MSTLSSTAQPIQETLFLEGGDFFQQLIEDIHQAQHTIDLEMYIFNHDPIGQKIRDALIAAAERGIQVRILIDGVGSPSWSRHMAKKLEQVGVQTRIFHPLPWGIWQWSRSFIRVPWLLKGIYLLLKINSRNHRKTCIIDQRIAFVGSMNISTCHLSTEEGGDGWRDTSIRLEHINTNRKEMQGQEQFLMRMIHLKSMRHLC